MSNDGGMCIQICYGYTVCSGDKYQKVIHYIAMAITLDLMYFVIV